MVCTGGIWGSFCLPKVRLREIIAKCLIIKDYMGDHTVVPLGLEERVNFTNSPVSVVMRQTDGNEG